MMGFKFIPEEYLEETQELRKKIIKDLKEIDINRVSLLEIAYQLKRIADTLSNQFDEKQHSKSLLKAIMLIDLTKFHNFKMEGEEPKEEEKKEESEEKESED